MIIAEILGGLGNQMFEYAHAYSLANILDKELFLDLSFFERYHGKDVFRLDKYNLEFKKADINKINKLQRKNIKPLKVSC